MTTSPFRSNAFATRGCVLVTGAAGLLGRELMAQFRAGGWETLGVDLEAADANTLVGDVADPEIARQACAGVDVVVHAAARQYHSGLPRVGRQAYFDHNVGMTRALLGAAEASQVQHFVFVSSDMSYGIPDRMPVCEDATQRPIGPYGRSKLACERLCLETASRGLRTTVFRPRLIVGPGRLGVLKTLFDRIERNQSIYMIGSGGNRYQMVSVHDVASGIVSAVETQTAGIFNLGSYEPPTVRDLLQSVIARAGSSSSLVSLPAGLTKLALAMLDRVRLSPLTPEQYRIAPVDFVLDTSAAMRQLDWRPQYNDADMLWSAYNTYMSGTLELPSAQLDADSISKPAVLPRPETPTQTH